MDIKYQYALSASNSLIHISMLSPLTRREGAPFTCPGCHDELIPSLGTHIQNHFRHKHTQPCSPEGYLHWIAKHLFAATYNLCVATKTPFLLKREARDICNVYETDFAFTCDQQSTASYDMTAYFESATVEKEYDSFRADVLLASSRRADVVFVEIVFSSPPSAEKLASGHRLVVIRVEGEADLEFLRHPQIDATQAHISLYNFQTHQLMGALCEGRCTEQKRMLIFTVYQNGKCRISDVSPHEALIILQGRKSSVRAVYEVVVGVMLQRENIPALFVRTIRDTYFKGIPVRNCFLCKYHGAGNGEAAIFCKANRESVASNHAVECSKYTTLTTPAEYEKIDDANREYQRKQFARQFVGGWLVQ